MHEIANNELKHLLRATAQGDGAAFRALYDDTSSRLLAVAFTMMRDASLAEDVLQDSFVQVWHRAGEYHSDRGGVLTWLTTIVRYRAIDLLRRRSHDGHDHKAQPVDADHVAFDYLANRSRIDHEQDLQNSPLGTAISIEENTNLRNCVERLSNRQQRSVALAFFRGFTHQELADHLEEPLGTIKSRLRRSLVRLKDCLEVLGGRS